MSDGADDQARADESGPPTAADFDAGFAAAEVSPGLRRVWRAAEPDLPPEIEPFSFISVALLDHVAAALALPPESSLADLAVCIDAFHFAADMPRAAREAFRILRRGGRLVLTDWQPRTPGDNRLSSRRRAPDWAGLLREAGFVEIVVEARPEWHETFIRVYRTVLEAGDPGDDPALAALQDEARRRLPEADFMDRVAVAARRP